jgi:predicted ATPase/DNA-binding SARP family transcriptional activator
VRVAVLGALQVFESDREVDLGGPMSRALVARLALSAGHPVAAGTLIDDLWDAGVPADAVNALQSIVSRTRRRLPEGTLVSGPAGYLLHAHTDTEEFRRLTTAGRTGEALRLWRGEALADLRDFPFVQRAVPLLEEARLSALETDLAARRPDAAVITELAGLARAHPFRDGLWLLYLKALVAVGRPTEALTVYQELRTRLASELGTDPSAELQRLHEAILRGGAGPVDAPFPAARHQLPEPLTSFVGRDDAVDDLRGALDGHRLVTVLGPGGAGKTRLAVETARAGLNGVRNAWLVELATVTDGEEVLTAVLVAMGRLEVTVLERSGGLLPPGGGARLLDGVADADGLLLLDNCEHLVDDVAAVAEQVLRRAPGLRVLATSREALQLIGEYTYQLGPLGLPADGAGQAEAAAAPAVRLFTERARAVDRDFRLEEVTLPAVLEICRRLDGQPLAIELAAARLRTLTVGEVAARLSDRFRLLTGGSRTLPRHRTLRAVVEWSWDLLTEAERDLAERVAVFPSGVTAEGATAVCDDLRDATRLLESLAEKSLLVPVRDAGRFRMLETLREYGVERLVERGVAEKVRSAHLDHCVGVAEELMIHLADARQVGAIRAFDAERGNLAAALRFAVDQGDRSRAARLVRAQLFYWAIRDEHIETSAAVTAVLALPGEAEAGLEIACVAVDLVERFWSERDPDWRPAVMRILRLWDEHQPEDPLTAVVLNVLDFLGVAGGRTLPPLPDQWTRSVVSMLKLVILENDGRAGEAVPELEETIAGLRSCGNSWGLAAVLNVRGQLLAYGGEIDAAVAHVSEALPLLERLGADRDAAFCRMRLMSLRLTASDAAGRALLRDQCLEELRAAESCGDRFRARLARFSLAVAEHLSGDHAASVRLLRQVLADLAAEGSFGNHLESMIRAWLAALSAFLGDERTARAEWHQAARLAIDARDMPIQSFVISARALVAELLDGDAELSARLLGTAEAVRGGPDRSNLDAEALARRLRERLGDARFEHLTGQGAAVPREDALSALLEPN